MRTAAAIAARIAPLGVAEDTEDRSNTAVRHSRFPVTTGRYAATAVVPISSLFDQVGPRARSVYDLVLFDSVVAGAIEPPEEVSLRGTRLGIDRTFFEASIRRWSRSPRPR
jgi:mandelamide amidase